MLGQQSSQWSAVYCEVNADNGVRVRPRMERTTQMIGFDLSEEHRLLVETVRTFAARVNLHL